MRKLVHLDAEALSGLLPFPALIDVLDDTFRSSAEAPLRHHHRLSVAGLVSQDLLIMPAWSSDHIAVKLVTLSPGNGSRGLPTIAGLVMLFDGATGQPVAILDAGELTSRRTAAASALAARTLAPSDAKCLLAVGGGRLIPYLVEAHSNVRSFERIMIWARNPDSAAAVVDKVRGVVPPQVEVRAVAHMPQAAADADVITMATSATEPLVLGEWIKPGTHLDLVGSYKPNMREVDDGCVRNATVFVDTYEGALSEAGEMIGALDRKVIDRAHVRADLAALVRGEHPGRTGAAETTLFKSVGTAVEDLAAAALAYRRWQERGE